MLLNDTLASRIAGVLVLLSIAAEFVAGGIGYGHGGPAVINSFSFGSGEQLAELSQSDWFVWLLAFGVLAPCLAMVAWPAMYQVLEPGGSTAFCGVVVLSLGMLLGVVAESIRLGLVMTLPSAYVGSPEAARPAMLAMGAVVGNVYQILDSSSFIVHFAVGIPLIAIAIVRGRQMPRWLGWSLFIPTILVGYVGAPLRLLGHPIGGLFLAIGLNVFFLCYVVIGVLLLRWRPSREIPG
jgi:hypothetical protein